MSKVTLSAVAFAAALALPALPALAQTSEIVIGITLTTTGPGAALGIPERNALEFVAKEIGGVPLKLIVLDDGGDPTAATTNARRFVTESKADIIMGSSTTPPTVAVSTVANEAGIPHFGLAPFPITPERAKWSVSMPQPIPIMGKVLYEHMKAHNIKTVGYIGYSDSYGDLWFNDLKNQAEPMGIKINAEELRNACNFTTTGVIEITKETRVYSGNLEMSFASSEVIIGGKGFGHGVGMCQYCAKGMAEKGWDWPAMMKLFYPGAGTMKAY